jgi:hypothetical protein
MQEAAIAASLAQAAGSVTKGYQRASELKNEALNYERRAAGIKLQGQQDSTSRYQELDSAMQTIAAIRGARNVSFNSPTAAAVDRALQKQATRGLQISQLGFAQEADTATMSAKSSRRASRFAKTSGWLEAIPKLIEAGGGIAGMAGGGKTGGGKGGK